MKEYVEFLRTKHSDTMQAIKSGKIDSNITDVLKAVANDIATKYN